MGDFCGTRRTFYAVRGTQAGDKLFETNIAGAVFKWFPGKADAVKKNDETVVSEDELFEAFADEDNSSLDEDNLSLDEDKSFIDEDNTSIDEDEFANDEFEDFEDFDNSDINAVFPFSVDHVGLIVYDEFGSEFGSNKFYAGGMAYFNLPAKFKLEAEALAQAASHNNAFIYYFEAKKSIMWGAAGNTSFEAGYFGKVKLDKGAKYFPAFSNLYLGEVMRMDSRDLPAVYAAVKHDFAWNWHTFLRLRYILQTAQNKIEEIDLEAVVNLFSHFKVALIAAHIKSNKLKEDDWAGRIEIRAGI